jgi:hypothetical protein
MTAQSPATPQSLYGNDGSTHFPHRSKTHRKVSLAALALIGALTLTGCGGGGGGGDPISGDDMSEAERLRRKQGSSSSTPPPPTTTPSTETTTTPPSTGTTTPTTGDTSTLPTSTPPDMTEGLNGIWPPPSRNLSSTACSSRLVGKRTTYDVGPGQPYTELTQVPWLSLQGGDVVNIHYRSTPYRTKVGLRPLGTPTAPIYINGVTDPSCNRPMISGANAVTATDAINAGFFGPHLPPELGVFVIYKLPTDSRDTYTPGYITFQNLHISGAKAQNTFKNQAGATQAYNEGAAAIYAIRVNHMTVENCEITGNGNGVFTNTRGQNAIDHSSYLIFRRNKVYLNGNANRSTEHNFYTQGYRVLFEGNDIGQAYGGSSLKDRSSGTVIRYNRVIASARALDLVETEEEYFNTVQSDPLNDYAWVYGNVIINDYYQPLGNSGRPIHYGFDNTASRARKNTLFFYGNTFINRSTQSTWYYTTVFQLGGNDDDLPHPDMAVEASGNIFWNDDGTTEWRFLANNTNGKIRFRGTNYLPTDRYLDNSLVAGTTTRRYDYTGHTKIEGYAPGINTTSFVPTLTSPVLDKGILGPTSTPSGVTAANLVVDREFTAPFGTRTRVLKGSAMDLGAFEQQ